MSGVDGVETLYFWDMYAKFFAFVLDVIISGLTVVHMLITAHAFFFWGMLPGSQHWAKCQESLLVAGVTNHSRDGGLHNLRQVFCGVE